MSRRRRRACTDRKSFFEPLEPRQLLSATIYVDAAAPGPTHDGTGWATAYIDLQQGLTAAASGDVIHVAHGTYKPTKTTTRTISYQLKNGVEIDGGYAGYGAASPDVRDPINTPTILSGNIGSTSSAMDNSYHVVNGGGVDATAVLDGVTISDGNANGTTTGTNIGGGLYCPSGSPKLNNCTFTANTATAGGGGAYFNGGATPSVHNCRFIANSAVSSTGGGVYVASSTLTFLSCTFTSNTAGSGGGAYVLSSGATITSCVFTNNSATGGGGGAVYSDTGPSTVTSCTFVGNSATSDGGAVLNVSSAAAFDSCSFAQNTASQAGALAFEAGASPSATNCTFTNNTASSNGGAVYIGATTPTIGNCTFTGDTASNGGGLYVIHCAVSVNNCDFRRNAVTHDGGAIMGTSQATLTLGACTFEGNAVTNSAGAGGAVYSYDASTSNSVAVSATNCAFVGNANVGSGGAVYVQNRGGVLVNCDFVNNPDGAVVESSGLGPATLINCIDWSSTTRQVSGATLTYCDTLYVRTGTGNISALPRFARMPTAGPDDLWATSDDDYGDLTLMAASPVVDAGNNAAVTAGTSTDLAGGPRFLDVPTTIDTGGGGAPIVDIGCYEVAPALVADAGGPYEVLQGSSTFVLHGRGASTTPGQLQYDWDFTGSGLFDDAHGPDPTISTASLPAGTKWTIRLRVTDSASRSVISTVTTLHVAPIVVDVDARATAGTGDGSSWANAFTSLATAMKQAMPGQVFHVAQGTYAPSSGVNRAVSFQLLPQMALYGGYAGLTAPNPDTRDPAAYPTVLSGNIGSTNSSADNTYNILNGNGTDATTILDGFTITAGNANGPDPHGSGAGLTVTVGAPVIRNCAFTANVATSGGAIFLNGAAGTTITGCTFVGNTAASGGAIYFAGGLGVHALKNSIFRGNVGTDFGGAIYSNYASEAPSNCVFVGNSAPYGGAIYGTGSSNGLQQPVVNCVFVSNTATASGNLGSALFNSYGYSPALANCIVWSNGPTGGKAINNGGAQATAAYCDVDGGYSGNGNIASDPLFLRAPSPGLDNVWGTADDDGDLRLSLGSPCVDTGSNAAVPAGVTTDLAGNARFFDFPGANDPGAIVDMGAYELGFNLGPIHAAAGQALALPVGGYAFTAEQLTLDAGGSLDLGDDQLTVTATTSNIRAYLADGQLRTTSTGGGLGYLDLGGGQTEVRFTLLGDTNLDGKVDVTDLGDLASTYGATSGATWAQGDFDYNGAVDVSDLGDLASSYGGSLGGSPAAAPPSATVAEPAARPIAVTTVNGTGGESLANLSGAIAESPVGGSVERLYLELDRMVAPTSKAEPTFNS